MMPTDREPLTLSAVHPDRCYSGVQFAEILGVTPMNVCRWVKRYRLPRTRNGKFLGATILKFCGRDVRRLKSATVTDAEFARREKAALERIKGLV
jgi:hypothetical protein